MIEHQHIRKFEHFDEFQPPHFFHSSLRLLTELASATLVPADDPKMYRLIDYYDVMSRQHLRTAEALTITSPLDRYLIFHFSMTDWLTGRGPLVTDDSLLPDTSSFQAQEEIKDEDQGTPDYDKLMAYIQEIDSIPSLLPSETHNLKIIINRAFRSYVFKRGINVEKYPILKYPYGYPDVADLLVVKTEDNGIFGQIFIHSYLQNPIAMQNLNDNNLNNYRNYNHTPLDSDRPPTLPVEEIKKEIISWSRHLAENWYKVDDDLLIPNGEDRTGLTQNVNVRGWARLDIDYDFAHLARKKFSVFVTYLMKEMATNNETLDMPGLDDDEQIDFLMGNLDLNNLEIGKIDFGVFSAKYYLPEYIIIYSIFIKILIDAKKIIESNTESLPTDIADMVSWVEACVADPDVMTFTDDGVFSDLHGIVVDIPSDDITPESMIPRLDPLLRDEIHDEIVTPKRQYYIYVHPLIWQEVRHHLGSDLKLG